MVWDTCMSIKGDHFIWLLRQNFKVGNLWCTSRERRPCDAQAGKEDHVMHKQGKKTLWSTSRESRCCRACFLSIFSSVGHLVEPGETILAILVKYLWNYSEFGPLATEKMSFEGFSCVEVLWPSQHSGVMLSMVSLPNHTFTGQS